MEIIVKLEQYVKSAIHVWRARARRFVVPVWSVDAQICETLQEFRQYILKDSSQRPRVFFSCAETWYLSDDRRGSSLIFPIHWGVSILNVTCCCL